MITPDWIMAGSQLVGALTGGGGSLPAISSATGTIQADGWTVATGRASAKGGTVSKPADALAAAASPDVAMGPNSLTDGQKLALAGLAGLALWQATRSA